MPTYEFHGASHPPFPLPDDDKNRFRIIPKFDTLILCSFILMGKDCVLSRARTYDKCRKRERKTSHYMSLPWVMGKQVEWGVPRGWGFRLPHSILQEPQLSVTWTENWQIRMEMSGCFCCFSLKNSSNSSLVKIWIWFLG